MVRFSGFCLNLVLSVLVAWAVVFVLTACGLRWAETVEYHI